MLTVHDLTYLKFPDLFEDRRLNDRGYRIELPRGLALADRVVAVSHRTADDLVALLGFPRERIRVIHEGVEERFFTGEDNRAAPAIRQAYGLTSPYLVFLVGTPEPRKNLARAAAAAHAAAPDFPLVLIGPKGPLQKGVGRHASRVIFTGVVPEDHLPALLGGALLALYPSLYEGFGLPVLECMAAGAPVLASNRGAIPEVAKDAAILVDPEDMDAMVEGIGRLLEDRGLREDLKRRGRHRASLFTWEKAAMETLSLYRELA